MTDEPMVERSPLNDAEQWSEALRMNAKNHSTVIPVTASVELADLLDALATENQAMRKALEQIADDPFEFGNIARDALASRPPVADEREGGE